MFVSYLDSSYLKLISGGRPQEEEVMILLEGRTLESLFVLIPNLYFRSKPS